MFGENFRFAVFIMRANASAKLYHPLLYLIVNPLYKESHRKFPQKVSSPICLENLFIAKGLPIL